MILYLYRSAFPCENSQVLPFVKENSFVDGELSAVDFGVTFENSESEEVLDIENNKLLLGLQFLDRGVLVPDRRRGDHHICIILLMELNIITKFY